MSSTNVLSLNKCLASCESGTPSEVKQDRSTPARQVVHLQIFFSDKGLDMLSQLQNKGGGRLLL